MIQINQNLKIFVLFILCALFVMMSSACGVKGPPLPSIPTIPQKSELQPSSRVFASPTPSTNSPFKGKSE